jgi:hypothetical protein
MSDAPYRPLAAFDVPGDVPGRHTTGQLPEGERAAGRVTFRLRRRGELIREGELEVDREGVVDLPVEDGDEPGAYSLEVGPLLRSMTLLPLAQ